MKDSVRTYYDRKITLDSTRTGLVPSLPLTGLPPSTGDLTGGDHVSELRHGNSQTQRKGCRVQDNNVGEMLTVGWELNFVMLPKNSSN